MSGKPSAMIKRGRGKPPYVPTDQDRNIVARAKGFGLRDDQIVHLLTNPRTGKAIDVETLNKYFGPELDSGAQQMLFNVAGSLYRSALAGNVAAQIFFLKCRGHGQWSPPREILLFDPTKMTQEELDAAIASVEKVIPGEWKVIADGKGSGNGMLDDDGMEENGSGEDNLK